MVSLLPAIQWRSTRRAEEQALEALAANGPGKRERESGYTALHYAAQYGMLRLTTALLDAGVDIDTTTKDLILQNTIVQSGGQTPLHLAARAGETEVAQLLLARMADATAKDFDGFAAVEIALLHRCQGVCKVLGGVEGVTEEGLKTRAKQASEAAKIRAVRQLDVPGHLRQVYTLQSVWSNEECSFVLDAVKTAVRESSGWTTDRHAAYATTDIPCSCVTVINEWVRQSLSDKVFPQLATRHGWHPDGSTLDFRDLFFVQYSAQGQAGLALHRDGSIISFNILLNSPRF